MSEMTSCKPYLIRAIYEWIADNGFTPHVAINANYPGVVVPQQHVEQGSIVLNISAIASKHLLITNDHIEFDARFGGLVKHIHAPIQSIKAIYARENNRGMTFEEEEEPEGGGPTAPPISGGATSADAGQKKSHLRVVK